MSHHFYLLFLRGIEVYHIVGGMRSANPNARICPLTHVSVDRAYQAESVGSNSLVSIHIVIRRSPNL